MLPMPLGSLGAMNVAAAEWKTLIWPVNGGLRWMVMDSGWSCLEMNLLEFIPYMVFRDYISLSYIAP